MQELNPLQKVAVKQFYQDSYNFFDNHSLVRIDHPNRAIRHMRANNLPINELSSLIESGNPVVHQGFLKLATKFLRFKRANGSQAEQALYEDMTMSQFIDRLLRKRPLTDAGYGSPANPESLRNYITRDEGSLASMISVVSKTFFTESGNMHIISNEAHQQEGVVIGNVAPRLHQSQSIDYKTMIITQQQNTTENGYGPEALDGIENRHLKLWAKFYKQPNNRFPTYQEASDAIEEGSQDYLALGNGKILNVNAYKERMKAVLLPMFAEANEKAENEGKAAFIRMFGLGTGVWGVNRRIQEKLILEICNDIIENNDLPNISDLEFSYFTGLTPADQVLGDVGNGEDLAVNGNNIKIHFASHAPAKKLTGNNQDKLLVTNYAWNDNAYPGNTYWLGNTYGNSDSAMARCSDICELHNIQVNPYICAQNLHIAFEGQGLDILQNIEGFELVQDMNQVLENRKNEAEAREEALIANKLNLAARSWNSLRNVEQNAPTREELSNYKAEESQLIGSRMLGEGSPIYDLIMSNNPKRIARILHEIHQRAELNQNQYEIGQNGGKNLILRYMPLEGLVMMAKIQEDIEKRAGGEQTIVENFQDLLDKFLNFIAKLFNQGVKDTDIRRACNIILNPLFALDAAENIAGDQPEWIEKVRASCDSLGRSMQRI